LRARDTKENEICLATVVTQRRKKPGPVPHSKKPPPKPAPSETAPSEAKKRASDEAPGGVYFKVKKRMINWGEGAEKVKLDAAIKEWVGGTMCPRPQRRAIVAERVLWALQHTVRNL
jgi:hypothetical protein